MACGFPARAQRGDSAAMARIFRFVAFCFCFVVVSNYCVYMEGSRPLRDRRVA